MSVAPVTAWSFRLTCPSCVAALTPGTVETVTDHVLRAQVSCDTEGCGYQGQLTVTLCATPPSRRTLESVA